MNGARYHKTLTQLIVHQLEDPRLEDVYSISRIGQITIPSLKYPKSFMSLFLHVSFEVLS